MNTQTTKEETIALMEKAGIEYSESQLEACQAYLEVMGCTDLSDFLEAYRRKRPFSFPHKINVL